MAPPVLRLTVLPSRYGIYVVSTFNTDCVLLEEQRLVESVQRLSRLGREAGRVGESLREIS